MPISLAQLQRLQEFKKHICQQCNCEFYSSRSPKYCNASCKQASYRNRLLNQDVKEEMTPIGFKNNFELVENESDKIKPIKKIKNEDDSLKILIAAEKRLKNIK